MMLVTCQGTFGFQFCPYPPALPLPEYWIEFTSPMAFCAFWITVFASCANAVAAPSASNSTSMAHFLLDMFPPEIPPRESQPPMRRCCGVYASWGGCRIPHLVSAWTYRVCAGYRFVIRPIWFGALKGTHPKPEREHSRVLYFLNMRLPVFRARVENADGHEAD